MRRRQITALMRKEWLEMTRSGLAVIVYNICLSLPLVYFALKHLSEAARTPAQAALLLLRPEEVAPYTLVFVAPVVIPFTATMLVQRRLLKEQLLGSLTSLLSTGVTVGDVWLGKVLACFALGYCAMLAALALNVALIRIVIARPIALSLPLTIVLLAVGPLLSMILVAVLVFMAFALRTTAVASLFGIAIIASLIESSKRMLVQPEVLVSGTYLAATGATIVVCLLYLAVNKLPKRYVLRL